MLYHVTMTHSEDNCPAYDHEEMVKFIARSDTMEALAKELKITVHYLLWGAPDHVAFALIEAESLGALGRYVMSMPIRQAFRVTPVQHLQDVVAMVKALPQR
jgi:hypothetical protein